jgi:hypothetical protein
MSKIVEKKVFDDLLDRGAPARGGYAVPCCRNDAIDVPLGDMVSRIVSNGLISEF